MSMSDEQFDQTLYNLRHMGMDVTAAVIRARDTAQRDALARVEAEREAMEAMVKMLEEKEWAEHASKGPVSSRLETCITTLMNELYEANGRTEGTQVLVAAYAEQRDTAQAQLAAAVGLLREVEPARYFADDLDARVEAFLARHAQAEQQEAQGAQAGDFWAWLNLAYRDGSKGEGRNFTKYNMEVAYHAGILHARAALATQPATKVECPDRALKKALFACVNAGSEPLTYGGVLTSGGYAWVRFTVEPAVRGAEHDQ